MARHLAQMWGDLHVLASFIDLMVLFCCYIMWCVFLSSQLSVACSSTSILVDRGAFPATSADCHLLPLVTTGDKIQTHYDGITFKVQASAQA